MRISKYVCVSFLALFSYASMGQANDTLLINNITYGGSGCPQGSVGKMIASDGQSFTLIYDDFTVEMLSKSWSRSNVLMGIHRQKAVCNLKLSLTIPKGQRITLESVDYRGYSDLEDGVAMLIESRHQFGNTKMTLWSAASLIGPPAKSFVKTATPLDAREMVYSTCGRENNQSDQLVLSTAFVLQRSPCTEGGGFISMDSLDGLVTSEEAAVLGGKKVIAQRFRVRKQDCN